MSPSSNSFRGIAADRLLPHRPAHASFLPSFDGRSFEGLLAFHRPALGNDPAPTVARRDHKDLEPDFTLGVAEAQRPILLTERAGEQFRGDGGKLAEQWLRLVRPGLAGPFWSLHVLVIAEFCKRFTCLRLMTGDDNQGRDQTAGRRRSRRPLTQLTIRAHCRHSHYGSPTTR